MSEEKKERRPFKTRILDILGGAVLAVVMLAFAGTIVRIFKGTISNETLLFLAGQGSIVAGIMLPLGISKFKKWRTWRKRIIQEDRPPTVDEIHEAFLDAIERLTGRRPNDSEIRFPGIPEEFLPKFNPGPTQGTA